MSSTAENDEPGWLGLPATTAVTLLAAALLATWIPHYLTWPWWPDLDTYATMARQWELGLVPYRETIAFNFPGQIYLFRILGATVGWGRTHWIYAVDAGLLVAFGLVLAAWSKRVLGRALPGLIGYVGFLGYYLGLDISAVAQRDWHGPVLSLSGVLLAQASGSKVARLVSALLFAAGVVFRPHVVLFLPALALALDERARDPGEPLRRTIGPLLGWSIIFGLALLAAFAPLMLAGAFPDFIRGVRLAGYGGTYSRSSGGVVLAEFARELSQPRLMVVPALVVLLGRAADRGMRRSTLTWLVLMGATLWYRPLCPMQHAYLDLPLRLTWAVGLAYVSALVLRARATPALRMATLLLMLALVLPARPANCGVRASLRAVASMMRGEEPAETPPGALALFAPGRPDGLDWPDYRATLDHLRRSVPPDVRVANLLMPFVGLDGPTGHPSPFTNEAGLIWLNLVHASDEPRLVADLELADESSLVVWVPVAVIGNAYFQAPELTRAVRRLYEPDRAFGRIEVWRRKREPS
ncbi:hypothetical protein EP7_001626 [Isosphaeraceae bacterium EP7]